MSVKINPPSKAGRRRVASPGLAKGRLDQLQVLPDEAHEKERLVLAQVGCITGIGARDGELKSAFSGIPKHTRLEADKAHLLAAGHHAFEVSEATNGAGCHVFLLKMKRSADHLGDRTDL